jgi:VanZ family protein
MSFVPPRAFLDRLQPGGAMLKVLAAACCLVIIVLSLLPGNERPHTGFSGNIEHVVAYAGTACFVALALRRPSLPVLVIAFSAASAFFEICQIWIPGRSAGFDNWFASTLGAVIGVSAARYIVLPRLSAWLARR